MYHYQIGEDVRCANLNEKVNLGWEKNEMIGVILFASGVVMFWLGRRMMRGDI